MKIGLIGNPNVGKSTIFNALTGMRQHTGNWPGKTVEKTVGYKTYKNKIYKIEDLPGTYSLMAHSKEEEITRNFVYFDSYDGLIIVCDATCLERNLNLALQVLEITNKVVLCINLVDQAEKKKININYQKLSQILNVPVVPMNARNSKETTKLLDALNDIQNGYNRLKYNEYIKKAISIVTPFVKTPLNKEAISLKLITNEFDYINHNVPKETIKKARKYLYEKGISKEDIEVLIAEDIAFESKKISKQTVTFNNNDYNKKDYLFDRIITGKITGSLLMIVLLFLILWLTVIGANYPSELLSNLFANLETILLNLLNSIKLPKFLIEMLIYGLYRTLSWVIAVMLPPMIIFFPLFTLLEDWGLLPRIAFNLDKAFKKCASCGKQALTMAMGFGCNAVGVVGTRIIDSQRERLIAIITNSLVPCNGRFPILISLITMFFITSNSFKSASLLTLFIILGIIVTFIISWILSKTILKGVPSAFTLELPPYRKPQIGKVIVHSILDKAIFILKRAMLISAPAGVIIWLMANISIDGQSVLKICTTFLNPVASLIGMDGVILMAFILGLPANEIVIPIIIMGYMNLGYINNIESISSLKTLFINNGWTPLTAICVMIFTVVHYPCLTTILTIKKETGSLKWTFLSVIIPLVVGTLLCFAVTQIYRLF